MNKRKFIFCIWLAAGVCLAGEKPLVDISFEKADEPYQKSPEGMSITRGDADSHVAEIEAGGWLSCGLPAAVTSGVYEISWDILPVVAEAYPLDQFAVDIQSDPARFGGSLISVMFRAFPNGDHKTVVSDYSGTQLGGTSYDMGKCQRYTATIDLDKRTTDVKCDGVVIANQEAIADGRDLQGVKFTSLPYGKAVFQADNIQWEKRE